MKNAIILHGKPGKDEYYDGAQPSASNAHWFPWLQKQLLIQDIKAETPEVLYAFDPDWKTWCREVERFEVGPETILVGHSCGGGFWVKYLSEHRELRVGRVVLVAPSFGLGWGDGGEHFFDNFEIDPKLLERTNGVTILNSDNDVEGIQIAVKRIRSELSGTMYREFHDYGHFCYGDMKTVEFPELLEEILKENS